MPKYRKKPVIVNASQWHKHGDHSMVTGGRFNHHIECFTCKRPMSDHGQIMTLEGNHRVCPGDWIIEGVVGEHYPCKPDIFEQTYEEVSDAS